jgi:CheY-like chemotaxis protein
METTLPDLPMPDTSLPDTRLSSGQAPRADLLPLVLIVDDDLAVRDSLAAVIEAFGFRTCTAGNGFEGLDAVAAETPSAIITDLHMPDMDGFELMSALRAAQSDIPIIAITGGVAKGYDFLSAARHMGAAATFHKPLAVLDLVDTIHDLTAKPA